MRLARTATLIVALVFGLLLGLIPPLRAHAADELVDTVWTNSGDILHDNGEVFFEAGEVDFIFRSGNVVHCSSDYFGWEGTYRLQDGSLEMDFSDERNAANNTQCTGSAALTGNTMTVSGVFATSRQYVMQKQ